MIHPLSAETHQHINNNNNNNTKTWQEETYSGAEQSDKLYSKNFTHNQLGGVGSKIYCIKVFSIA